MKRSVSLSISAALAASTLACSAQSPQLKQCKAVVESYIRFQSLNSETVELEASVARVALSFSVPSALGPQPGSALCEYTVSQDGKMAAKPFAISLGDSRYTVPQDIDDLLAGRYSDGLPAHAEH